MIIRPASLDFTTYSPSEQPNRTALDEVLKASK